MRGKTEGAAGLVGKAYNVNRRQKVSFLQLDMMSEPWKYRRGIPWGRRSAVAEA